MGQPRIRRLIGVIAPIARIMPVVIYLIPVEAAFIGQWLFTKWKTGNLSLMLTHMVL